MEIFACPIMRMVAPGYTGEILSEAVVYFRVLMIGFTFSLVASLYQNILNAEKIYGYANFSSIINSTILITIILTLTLITENILNRNIHNKESKKDKIYAGINNTNNLKNI